MIPFIRSLNELMIITQPRNNHYKSLREKEGEYLSEDNGEKKKYSTSKEEIAIKLPNLPKNRRQRWIKGKEVVSKFFDELDYNNNIQSTYDITLIERQKNHEQHDVA